MPRPCVRVPVIARTTHLRQPHLARRGRVEHPSQTSAQPAERRSEHSRCRSGAERAHTSHRKTIGFEDRQASRPPRQLRSTKRATPSKTRRLLPTGRRCKHPTRLATWFRLLTGRGKGPPGRRCGCSSSRSLTTALPRKQARGSSRSRVSKCTRASGSPRGRQSAASAGDCGSLARRGGSRAWGTISARSPAARRASAISAVQH
jgi:hypothetical protein